MMETDNIANFNSSIIAHQTLRVKLEAENNRIFEINNLS